MKLFHKSLWLAFAILAAVAFYVVRKEGGTTQQAKVLPGQKIRMVSEINCQFLSSDETQFRVGKGASMPMFDLDEIPCQGENPNEDETLLQALTEWHKNWQEFLEFQKFNDFNFVSAEIYRQMQESLCYSVFNMDACHDVELSVLQDHRIVIIVKLAALRITLYPNINDSSEPDL
jgi:hypothetical protein